MPEVDAVRAGAGRLGEQLLEPLRERLSARKLPRARLRLERPDDLRGGAGAHVRVDQRLLEPLPGLLVEVLEHARLELRSERLARLRQVLAEPAEEPAALFRLLAVAARGLGGLAAVRDEELSPAARHWEAQDMTRA